MRHLGHGADLALVDAAIFALRVLDLQGPVIGVLQMDGLEALVTGVSEPAHGQHMQVLPADPRHLQSNEGES